MTKFILLLQNHRANFKQTLHKVLLGEGDSYLFTFFPRGVIYEIAKIHWQMLKNLLLQNHTPISTKLGTKHSWMKKIQVSSNEGLHPFQRGDNNEIAKIHWWNLKIFFSKTIQLISTKLCTKHPWVIHVCWKGRQCLFSRGVNYEIAKIHYPSLKIFSRIIGPISTKLGIKGEGDSRFYKKNPFNSTKGDDWFSPLQINILI